jgi:hypothetical protein
VGEWRAVKMRAGVGAVKEGVLVSLERRVNNSEKVIFLVVRSEATKVVLYHAFLLPGTRTNTFMGRKENIKLTVFHQKAEEKQLQGEEKSAEEHQEGEAKQEGEVKQDESKQEAKQEEVKQEGKHDGAREEREQVKLQFEREEDAASFQQLVSDFSAGK